MARIMCQIKICECMLLLPAASLQAGNGRTPVGISTLTCPECERTVTVNDFGKLDGIKHVRGVGLKRPKRASCAR